jgi:high-affinity K+ transport system ATPase subunit B
MSSGVRVHCVTRLGDNSAVGGRLCGHFRFDATSDVGTSMLPKMILAVEALKRNHECELSESIALLSLLTFAALIADMFLLTRVNDVMQRQLLLALECLHANLKTE